MPVHSKRAPPDGTANFCTNHVKFGPTENKNSGATAVVAANDLVAVSWEMNCGQPKASAFVIPPFGQEVLLADVPTQIEVEQFWWVVGEWAREGEGILKSIWRTELLDEDFLTREQREWYKTFTWGLPEVCASRTVEVPCKAPTIKEGADLVVKSMLEEYRSEPAGGAHSEANAQTLQWAKLFQGGILAALATARRRGVYCEARKDLTESDPEMCQSIRGEGAGRTPEIEKYSTQSQDHLRRATQVEPNGTNTEDQGGSSHRVLVSGEPTWGERRWLRRVFRKDVVTAEYLDEWVATSRSPQRSRIWFTPVLPPEGSSSKPVMSYLPYNYPKSRRWSLEFCPAKPSGEPARLAMLANVFDPASIVYLQVSAKRILTKLEKWGSCVSQGGVGTSYKKRVAHDVLVPQPAFRASYRALKAKYKHWADDWPEKTDPQKFVFEETGIAAYLVALWRQKEFQPAGGSRRVRFVDLGCGNGFLTHLLVSEGHEGFGLDKVSRKIWDLYPSDTRERLRVEDVDPEQATFPEVDWLIGNHSDELTPWLPEIARRSGPGTRYFVIPCCFWDRQGKYTHKAAGETRYETYLRFVERCGTDNGFKVRSEPLRIPSTKNIAQVGVPHTTRCESIETK